MSPRPVQRGSRASAPPPVQMKPALELWRRHMQAVGDVVLETIGQASVIDILD